MNELKKEARELGIRQRGIALTLDVSDSVVSDYFSGVRRPPDSVLRQINFIYSFVRSEHMRVGHFEFSRAGIKLLRKKIREMESSIVKSTRPVNNDAPVEESAPCAN
jgi:predicted transcriptional regulator